MMILSLLCLALLVGHSHGTERQPRETEDKVKMCTTKHWEVLPESGMMVKLFSFGKSEDNRKVCEDHAADLISLSSVEKLDEVTKWMATKPKIWTVRQVQVGLTRTQGKPFVWENEVPFNNELFELESAEGNDCVTHRFNLDTTWTSIDCESLSYPLCESPSTELCTTHAVFYMYGERMYGTSHRALPGDTHVTVECFFDKANKESITEIDLSCPDYRKTTASVQKRLAHSFLVTQDMHREHCICTVLAAGKKRIARINFTYIRSPRLMNSTDNNQTILAQKGSDASVHFVVLALPFPSNFTLTRNNDTYIPEDEYVLVMGYYPKPLHTAITLEFLSLHQDHDGDYNFTIENGMEPNLEVVFAIKVSGSNDERGSNSNLFFYFCLLIILCVVIGVAVSAGFRYKEQRAATIVSSKRSTKLSKIKRSVVYTINGEEEECVEEIEEEEEDESEDDDRTVTTAEFPDFKF